MKASDALRRAIPLLREAGIEDGSRDARVLLAHALGIGHDRLTLKLPEEMTAAQEVLYDSALRARLMRQPVAQITGRRLFWGLSFRVTRDTLDPRPETETLVAEALSHPFLKMLDLGTGTGCILLSCLKAMPMARGLGTDISDAALQVAMGNTRDLGLEARARFRKADWFAGVTGAFDLIVSNPPYIAEGEMPDLAPEVRDWEPHLALSPGGDGLDGYRAIARGAGARLLPGGRLLVEIGPTQAAPVAALFAAAGLERVRVLPDLDGRDRVVVAVKPEAADRCGCA
ncbi:peptide chain release factor N(5)-glutamine methyltransferase [Tabrizicola sp.]|uniref:peptide chain release factor N(5)-glutamine methyltransferase n=1 Tax=Tabrizicola sp. TaxID=2005166 RepID=UPI000BDB1AB1|nr:peptide chain release factor N(5)-glutamine methyltransferase [Tabrizicola sp.]MBY0350840.1 peptide chain release factor N(5)-glutamine methyltransferase [Tabrizicola sp.]MDK2774833.1 peptide chain release factor N(5)-glutamine methyltransferase [Tabrizicola sp.]OYX20709.1 MAG: protein-(glutamine-N5) methyltransferase, release factor-specific [Rhodobacterales bacterium 32-66-9]